MKVSASLQHDFVELDSILPGETFLISGSFYILAKNISSHLLVKSEEGSRVIVLNLTTGALMAPVKSTKVKRIPLKVVLDD